MNRKRALYRYEFGNMKWMFVAGIGCCVLVLLMLNSAMMAQYNFFEIGVAVGSWQPFSAGFVYCLQMVTPLALIAIGIMSILQFSDYHKRNRREYIVSLPYTQRERFIAKFAVGSGILTAVCLVFGIGVYLLRETYFNNYSKVPLLYPGYRLLYGNDTWLQTLRTLVVLWVVVLTAYAVFVAVHSLVSRGVLASLISLGMLATPIYVIYVICLYGRMMGNYEFANSPIIKRLEQICGAFVGQGYFKYQEWIDSEMSQYGIDLMVVDYGDIGIVIIVLLVALIAFATLAYWANVKQDGAKFGCIVPNPCVRVVLSVGTAICFSLPIALLLTFCIGYTDGWRMLLAVQIAVAIGLYFVNQIIFKKVVR